MAEFHVTFRSGGAGGAKEFEDEDPFEFVACSFPSPPGHDVDLEMARTFVEEYALMGFSRPEVARLFNTQFFGGTHDLLRRRGTEFVEAVLDEVFAGAAAPAAEGN